MGDHNISRAEYSCDLMDDALTPDCPLEAHLWRPAAQADTKMLPAFRSNRDYYTRTRLAELIESPPPPALHQRGEAVKVSVGTGVVAFGVTCCSRPAPRLLSFKLTRFY